MTDFLELIRALPPLFVSLVFVLGLVVGSFLNVVILRLPKMLDREWRDQCRQLLEPDSEAPERETFNLVTPGSRCPGCGKPVRAWENIPVVSWLVLRGRCSGCGMRISMRYPMVELASGAAAAVVAAHFGVGWACLGALLLTWSLIALTMIDFDHQLLPDDITLPALWLGIGFALSGTFTDLQSAVIGAGAGYLSLWSVYWLFKYATGKEGMGYGDFKLLAMLGAWLGWQMLPAIILLSAVVGAVAGVALIVLQRQGRGVPMPFGPYLAAAGWVALLWGEDINRAYLQFAGLA